MEESTEPKETNKKTERTKLPKTRTFSRYVLPSNRHPFSVHSDVVRRFVTISRNGAEGVAAAMVEGSGVPVQAASMNVRFLRSIGLLVPTERGRYIPTQEAIRFVNAKSVSDERARPILSALISPTWFAEVARSVFAGQPIMSEDQFLGELALAAQTDKVREETALSVLLEYLIYTRLVTRDERGLSIGTGTGAPTEQELALGGALGAAVGAVAMPMPTSQTQFRPAGVERISEPLGWEILQTQDFYVKVKSDPNAVDDLVDFLQTLKKKITRLRGAAAQPSVDQSAPGEPGKEQEQV